MVRPHRRYVEEFPNRERWTELTATDVVDITEHLTPLPSPDEDEEFARRFDLLILNLQLAILETSHKQERYQQQVRALAGNLEEKQAIPSVAEQLELILAIQADEYWQHVTLPMLESVRRKLRDLIKFIDRHGGREIVYSDFEDEIGEGNEVGGLITTNVNLQNFRLKVDKFVREHETHVTIQRLKNNLPIYAGDVDSLEAMLFGDGGPGCREDYDAIYGTNQPLGTLIRQIVGLDRNAAKEAFAAFLAAGSLTGDQITFINLIIDHLADNGIMDPHALFEPPFTDFHDHGIAGMFPERAEQVVSTIETVNANAVVQ